MRWDPVQYERYLDERARPFTDLVARAAALAPSAPRRVVDLGCGPGTQTATLAARWPGAQVEGVDHSAEMIAAAMPLSGPRLQFTLADLTAWTVPADADLVLSNAALQWVPGHRELLTRWAGELPAGAVLAVQMPRNFDAPSHTLLRELADDPRWRDRLGDTLRHHDWVGPASSYLELLLDTGLQVDAWETTYLHLLTGADPVVDWLRGTGLRPVLAALDDADGARFTAELAERLREAYPPGPHGTVLPFRRVFVVGRRATRDGAVPQ